jgi:hypothetical protein
MNLAWIRDTEDISDDDKGIILQEFGHTLGQGTDARVLGQVCLGHEHQSHSFGGTITLKKACCIRLLWPVSLIHSCSDSSQQPNFDPEHIHRNMLDVYNNNEISNYSKVDLNSVMLCV